MMDNVRDNTWSQNQQISHDGTCSVQYNNFLFHKFFMLIIMILIISGFSKHLAMNLFISIQFYHIFNLHVDLPLLFLEVIH